MFWCKFLTSVGSLQEFPDADICTLAHLAQYRDEYQESTTLYLHGITVVVIGTEGSFRKVIFPFGKFRRVFTKSWQNRKIGFRVVRVAWKQYSHAVSCDKKIYIPNNGSRHISCSAEDGQILLHGSSSIDVLPSLGNKNFYSNIILLVSG